jgi:AcrR family transcriptional regulator
MVSHARERPKLTAKGERARARIVAASAHLIHQRGVAGTTLEDVKAAADVRGSQLYHYFPDKDDLVQAVLDYQADTAVNNRRQARFRQHRTSSRLARLSSTSWPAGCMELTWRAADWRRR